MCIPRDPAIVKFTPGSGGTWTKTTMTSGLNSQPSVAVDVSGNVYTADTTTGRIYKIPPASTVNASSTNYITDSNVVSPRGLAVDAQGDIYVSSQATSSVYRIGINNGGTLFAVDTCSERPRV